MVGFWNGVKDHRGRRFQRVCVWVCWVMFSLVVNELDELESLFEFSLLFLQSVLLCYSSYFVLFLTVCILLCKQTNTFYRREWGSMSSLGYLIFLRGIFVTQNNSYLRIVHKHMTINCCLTFFNLFKKSMEEWLISVWLLSVPKEQFLVSDFRRCLSLFFFFLKDWCLSLCLLVVCNCALIIFTQKCSF